MCRICALSERITGRLKINGLEAVLQGVKLHTKVSARFSRHASRLRPALTHSGSMTMHTICELVAPQMCTVLP